jgi:predicted dehydrogenase
MALRIAIAGMGDRGRQWAREVQGSPEWELVACADVDDRALEAAASALELSDEMCFGSLAEALDTSPCDVAVVATTSNDHVGPCEEALSRGVGALVEKPFAPSIAAAAALVELAEQRGVPLVVGQNYRYTRAQRTVRRLLREGALGQVRMVVCQTYRVPELLPKRVPIPPLALWEHAVHYLDALRHSIGELTGVMVESFGGSEPGSPPGPSLHSMLAFEGGARGLYSATYESSGHEYFERGQEFYERIVGDRATLHVIQRWLVLCARGKLPRIVRRGRRPVTEDALLIGQLERALRHGEEPDASGRDNLRTVAALEACARSAEERRWMDPRELLAAHV